MKWEMSSSWRNSHWKDWTQWGCVANCPFTWGNIKQGDSWLLIYTHVSNQAQKGYGSDTDLNKAEPLCPLSLLFQVTVVLGFGEISTSNAERQNNQVRCDAMRGRISCIMQKVASNPAEMLHVCVYVHVYVLMSAISHLKYECYNINSFWCVTLFISVCTMV